LQLTLMVQRIFDLKSCRGVVVADGMSDGGVPNSVHAHSMERQITCRLLSPLTYSSNASTDSTPVLLSFTHIQLPSCAGPEGPKKSSRSCKYHYCWYLADSGSRSNFFLLRPRLWLACVRELMCTLSRLSSCMCELARIALTSLRSVRFYIN
jgi:hypothetical protein